MAQVTDRVATGRRIFKNTGILMGSQMVTWGLSLLLTIVMARYLGAVGIGKLQLATSIWAIMTMFASFGMDTMLVKEIARSPERISEIFGTSLILRTLLFGLSYGIVFFYLQEVDYPADTKLIIYLVSAANLIYLYVNACQAALQGLERVEFSSIATISDRAISALLIIVLLVLGYGVKAVAVAMAAGALMNLIVQFSSIKRLHRLGIKLSTRESISFLRKCIPYLMSNVFLIVYQQVDTVIISYFINEEAVGWYSTADRLFTTLLFVPTVFMTAVFPVFSRMSHSKDAALNQLLIKSFNTLLLLSVPIGFGIFVIANPLAVLLFGSEFAPSGPVLAIFGLVLLLTYQNMLLGQFLISIDRQNSWTLVMVVATILTVPLDMVLVPWCHAVYSNGAMGGALAFVITEMAMMFVGFFLLPRETLQGIDVWLSLRIIAAGLLMVVGIWWLRNQLIIIPILAGASIYGVLVWGLRLFPQAEMALVTEMVQQLMLRMRGRKPEPSAG